MKNCRVHPTHWLISTQVFTPYELEVRALRSRDLEAYKKPTPLTQQFDRECKYDYKEEGLSFDPRVSTKQSFCSKVFDWCCCCCICCCCLCGNQNFTARSNRRVVLHAIEQASRRWRGGRRDDSGRTRRESLIYVQSSTNRTPCCKSFVS